MQQTIAQQLGLDVSTVANFFMNARRRSVDRWKDEANRIAAGATPQSAAAAAAQAAVDGAFEDDMMDEDVDEDMSDGECD